MSRRFNIVFILLLSLVGHGSLLAGEAYVSVRDMVQIESEIMSLLSGMKPEEVLFVTDFDHLMATSPTYYGSEPWFSWLVDLQKKDPNQLPEDLRRYENLLLYQSLVLNRSGMVPADPESIPVFRRILHSSLPSIILTSRNPLLQDGVNHFLGDQVLPFSKVAPGPVGGFSENYMPYTLEELIHDPYLKDLKLPEQMKIVRFQNGVYLTRGQHKGAMLYLLLKKLQVFPKTIIFLDDEVRHLEAVSTVFGRLGIQSKIFHYSPQEVWKNRFRNDARLREEVFQDTLRNFHDIRSELVSPACQNELEKLFLPIAR